MSRRSFGPWSVVFVRHSKLVFKVESWLNRVGFRRISLFMMIMVMMMLAIMLGGDDDYYKDDDDDDVKSVKDLSVFSH